MTASLSPTPPAEFDAVRREGDEHNVCGCTALDADGRAQSEARFPDTCSRELTIYINADDWPGAAVMGLNWGEWCEVYQQAMAEWNQAANVHLVRVDRSELAIAEVDFADLAGQTLAWSHLADGSCAKNKRQRYDHRQWTPELLRLTALHELGHLLGLQHKNGPYIMNPSILTGLAGLTQDDVQRARALGYGAPVATEPNPSPQPDPVPEPEPRPPLAPGVPWGDVFARVIYPLIAECIANRGRRAAKRALQRPGPLVWRRIRRRAAETIQHAAPSTIADLVLADLELAGEADIELLLDEAPRAARQAG